MARTRNGFTDMNWDKLKVFHAAAEAGSFTHAGEQLGLSQSAVSRQVSALEQELNVSLFHRHARGLILTEQGELLHRTAHDVFMKLEAARAKLTDSRERPNGDLRVTTTPGIGVHWLTPRRGEFIDLYAELPAEPQLADRGRPQQQGAAHPVPLHHQCARRAARLSAWSRDCAVTRLPGRGERRARATLRRRRRARARCLLCLSGRTQIGRARAGLPRFSGGHGAAVAVLAAVPFVPSAIPLVIPAAREAREPGP